MKFEIVLHIKHNLKTLGDSEGVPEARTYLGSSEDALEAKGKEKVQSRTKSCARFIPLKILVLASDLLQMKTMLIVCTEKWISECRLGSAFRFSVKVHSDFKL